VPRATFKLKPESETYWVLTGNEQARPPRYDLESLRLSDMVEQESETKRGG
jgi:hypothetical protein